MQPSPSAAKWARESRDWFGFASLWLGKWREFFQPITEQNKAKPNQTQITFDTQLKPDRYYHPILFITSIIAN